MSWYRRFQRLPNVPRQRYTDEIILFADSAGALKTVDEDGTVAAVAGAGSLPNPTNDGDVLTVVTGAWAGAPGGGSQPGALRVLPVVIDLAALALGEQTLYTPAAGEWVVVSFSQDGFVASDVDWDLFIGQNLAVSPANYYMKKNDISEPASGLEDMFGNAAAATASSRHRAGVAAAILDGLVEGTAPLVAALKPDFDVTTVFCVVGGSWLPNHAYAGFDTVQGSDGALYQADAGGGTSGGTQPTWPGNGGSVADNDITWSWAEDPPSVGTYTAVLLIGGAV